MWAITFTHRARKDFLPLEKGVQERIAKKLDSAKSNPKAAFESLSNAEYFKLRIGDYRVVATMDNEKNEITIHRIGHRKNIYGKI